MTAPKTDLVQVQIVVNITFDANGEDHEWLRANAHKAMSNQFGNGNITGGSDAVVDSYDIKAKILSPAAAALEEDALRDWLNTQIEDGHMELRTLSTQMARFALADAGDMREELAERMANTAAENEQDNQGGGEVTGTERYMSDEGWAHCFTGSTETTIRWVIDRHKGDLIHAQSYSGLKWVNLSLDEAKDVAQSLKDNEIMDDFGAYQLGNTLPNWAASSKAALISIPVGEPVPSASRIIALLIREAWVNDNAVEIDDGKSQHDVTSTILAMSASDIRALDDSSDTTDDLVTHDHTGPFRVDVCDSVCKFFGVDAIDEVTDAMLQTARASTDANAAAEDDAPTPSPVSN